MLRFLKEIRFVQHTLLIIACKINFNKILNVTTHLFLPFIQNICRDTELLECFVEAFVECKFSSKHKFPLSYNF